jgi:hypothetical protein
MGKMQTMIGRPISLPGNNGGQKNARHQDLGRLREILELGTGSGDGFLNSLPFAGSDATAGSENELQVAVIGKKEDVDLPMTIAASNYYQNIIKRIRNEEIPQKVFTDLDRYLEENKEKVWENSWVRLPVSVLSPYTKAVIETDLLADKKNPSGPTRKDAERFFVIRNGTQFLRIPASYLLKLSLAEVIGSDPQPPPVIKSVGERLLGHFSSDNTSPEIHSFHPVVMSPASGMGKAAARETSIRFLLSQLLVLYANHRFQLLESGQETFLYFAPHPPVRQQALNEMIPDAFYRELFMNPCLSGWDRGEEKHQYMILCHQVLSRSQLHSVAKLREAGIITRNLIVLPNISNTSLANNGTHISLGSRRLTRLLKEKHPEFGPAEEKFVGDLVIKIFEHFLSLFVGTYTAAPYRLEFWDFHPERIMAFLPHELDYTHLRMIWRRWQKKANLKVLGRPFTPFGPTWLDRMISRIFLLRGDFIPDFRLIDYPVCMMSTPQCPALNGVLGNDQRLKNDLADLGVYDARMSLYLLYRLRQFDAMGFSGFEGRHYSIFEKLMDDLGEAATLQTLITALAFKYILQGELTHERIPDEPALESERRQIFFGSAIGIPTFFVRKDTRNEFLLRVLRKTERTRPSHRYPGYIRVYNLEYRRALVRILKEDARDLIEMMNLEEAVRRLEERIENPGESAQGRITRGILEGAGASSPLKLSGAEFNRAAERYYRHTLRRRQAEEALLLLEEEFKKLDSHAFCDECLYKETQKRILGSRSAAEFLSGIWKELDEEHPSLDRLRQLIHLILLVIHSNQRQYERDIQAAIA